MVLPRHLFLVILVMTQLSLVAARQTPGKLRPDDPTLAVGMTLSLVCTLNKSYMRKNHVNASSIVFTISRRETTVMFPNKFVVVVNKRVAVLTYPNIGIRYNSKSVCCTISNSSVEVECQHIVVGYLPYKPVVTDIRVGENLTFSWKVAKKNNVYTTNYIGFWKTSDMLKFKPCDREVCCEQYDVDELYTVMVVGTNRLGNVTSEEAHFYPRDYVRPSVPGLRTHPDNATCVTLSWNPPKRSLPFVYNVSYKSLWGSTNQTLVSTLIRSDDNVSTQICRLLPHTMHVFAVRAKFASVTEGKLKPYGLWSALATRRQLTATTIPSKGAEVTQGGYHVTEVKGHARTVRVYWKHIPKVFQNGDILGYRITYVSPPNITTSFVGPECNWASLKLLNVEHLYHIFVDAKTSAGYNEKRLPGMIAVAKMSQMPAAGVNFTVFWRNKTSVYFEWTVDPGMVGYTSYWCRGSQNDFTCVTELQWQILPAWASNFSVELSASHTFYGYLFGMSAETALMSTGIVWSTCIYEVGKVPAPPRIKIQERYSDSLVFSLEKPSCAQSRGYITGYNVYYCQLDKKGNCIKKKIETYIPGNKATRHTLQGLWPDHKYLIDVRSVSTGGVSYAASLEANTTGSTGLSAASLISIVVAALVAVVFCIIGLGWVCRVPSKLHRWMITLPIIVPQPNKNSLGKEKDLDIEDSGYGKHMSDSGGDSSTPLFLHPVPAFPVGYRQVKPSVMSPLQDDCDSDTEDDAEYATTRVQVEPLVFSPIGSSCKTVVSSYSKAAIGHLSLTTSCDDCHSVNTLNNFCDGNDINSSDDDDGYCKAVTSHIQQINSPNIFDSDDDNGCGDMVRVSQACRPIDAPRRGVSDMSNNDSCGYSKVVTSAMPRDTPDRDVSDTDGSRDDDYACGYAKVVTSTTQQGDIDGSNSDNDDVSGYSKVVTSTTSGDTPSTQVGDSASSDSNDEDDITGYSKMATSNFGVAK